MLVKMTFRKMVGADPNIINKPHMLAVRADLVNMVEETDHGTSVVVEGMPRPVIVAEPAGELIQEVISKLNRYMGPRQFKVLDGGAS